MFDFSIVTQWFDQLLQLTLGCPEWLAIYPAGICADSYRTDIYGA